jgi:hypothetical protein
MKVWAMPLNWQIFSIARGFISSRVLKERVGDLLHYNDVSKHVHLRIVLNIVLLGVRGGGNQHE